MTQVRIDQLRAALMLFVANIVTALVLLQIVDWTGEQVAGITAAINSGMIVVALLFPSPPTPAPFVTGTTGSTAPPPSVTVVVPPAVTVEETPTPPKE